MYREILDRNFNADLILTRNRNLSPQPLKGIPTSMFIVEVSIVPFAAAVVEKRPI